MLLLDEFKKTLSEIELDFFINRIISDSPLSFTDLGLKHHKTLMQVRYLEHQIITKYHLFYTSREQEPPPLSKKKAKSWTKWTYDLCLQEAKKHPNIIFWRQHQPSYSAAYRRSWIDDAKFRATLLQINPAWFGLEDAIRFNDPSNEIQFINSLDKEERLIYQYRLKKGEKLITMGRKLAVSYEWIRIRESRVITKLTKFLQHKEEESKLLTLLFTWRPELKEDIKDKKQEKFKRCVDDASQYPNITVWRACSPNAYLLAFRSRWLDHPDFIAPLLAINKKWFKRHCNKQRAVSADERSSLLKILEDPNVPEDKKEALQRIRNMLLGHRLDKESEPKYFKDLDPGITKALKSPELSREEKKAIRDVFAHAPTIKKKPKQKKPNAWMWKYFRRSK